MSEIQKIDEKHYVVQCLEVDAVNKNNRLYPKAVILENIKNLQEKINNRALIGELGMPNSVEITLANASHLVTALKLDSKHLTAEIEVMDTPSGKILLELLRHDAVCFRTAGIGNGKVGEDGVLVVEKFKLNAIHAVPLEL